MVSVSFKKSYYFRAVLDCMVLPLQDKLEDWKKSATTMDKDHAKEYKKLRSEVKKRSELYLFFIKLYFACFSSSLQKSLFLF